MEINTAPDVMDSIIHLNVGGKLYTTSKNTLTKYSDSMLCRMIEKHISGNIRSAKDAHGNIVIDRDGDIFRFVLIFLRCGKLILPEKFTEFALLEEEAEFYLIQPLIDAVKASWPGKTVKLTVKLTVGGIQGFTISSKALTKHPESLLYRIAVKDTCIFDSKTGDVMMERDDEGNITIHRDSHDSVKMFHYVLTFLKCDKLIISNYLSLTDYESLREEARYYCIPPLIDAAEQIYKKNHPGNRWM